MHTDLMNSVHALSVPSVHLFEKLIEIKHIWEIFILKLSVKFLMFKFILLFLYLTAICGQYIHNDDNYYYGDDYNGFKSDPSGM